MNTRMSTRRSAFLKTSLKETAVILSISAVLALAVNGLRPHPLPLLKNPSQPLAAEVAPIATDESDSRSISIEGAVQYFEQETALFVDARMPADYAAGHIQGAVNLPDHRFDEKIGPFLEATVPETPIITYCDGINCPLSKDLAEKLVLMGFENVYHLPDGWASWQAHRMPIEKGE